MKKILILAIVFIGLFTSSTTVKERTTMDILTSYKWCMNENALAAERDTDAPDGPYYLEYYFQYNDTLGITCERWSDEPDKLDCVETRYYLETQLDGKEPKFVDSKVGKNKNGTYIFEKPLYGEKAVILRIIELTEKKLVIIPIGAFGEQTVWEARPKD